MTSVLPARLKKTYLITVYIILIGLAMISLYYRDQIAQVFPAFSVLVQVILFL